MAENFRSLKLDLWPAVINQFIEERFGAVINLEGLGGQSGSKVYRLCFKSSTTILKISSSSKEKLFYERLAPIFAQNRIRVPRLRGTVFDRDLYWIFLEDIPTFFPVRSGAFADISGLEMLYQLHSLPLNHAKWLEKTDFFLPEFNGTVIDQALTCFNDAVGYKLEPELIALQTQYQHLFSDKCFISGDPNPTNWGYGQDGTLVLFDWERLGFGTPPLDLAITIAGTGCKASFEETAFSYLKVSKKTYQDQLFEFGQLIKDIAAAKVWSMIEYLSNFSQGRLNPNIIVANLIAIFPNWLNKTFQELKLLV